MRHLNSLELPCPAEGWIYQYHAKPLQPETLSPAVPRPGTRSLQLFACLLQCIDWCCCGGYPVRIEHLSWTHAISTCQLHHSAGSTQVSHLTCPAWMSATLHGNERCFQQEIPTPSCQLHCCFYRNPCDSPWNDVTLAVAPEMHMPPSDEQAPACNGC